MKLQIYKTLWGHEGSIEEAAEQAQAAHFDGIEGPAPESGEARRHWRETLEKFSLRYIAEITTAGSYVPDRHASLDEHLRSFARKLERSLELEPEFISCLGGCDAWPEAQNLAFFDSAMNLAEQKNATVSFETHRGRAFFNPWVTQRIVRELPEIKLTCDFSHWCVVCERLMDSERDTLEALAPNAFHIHARVGYDQGPQVPHPAAPEYAEALRAHQSWWEGIWLAQARQGREHSTMTPEFGPDGYLQQAPFTQEPVADLWEVNRWMAQQEREHFLQFSHRQYIQPTRP